MVTHEMYFARKVSDPVVFMHQGLIHEVGAPDTLFTNPQTPELQHFLSSLQSQIAVSGCAMRIHAILVLQAPKLGHGSAKAVPMGSSRPSKTWHSLC